jgi:hypothetical protein
LLSFAGGSEQVVHPTRLDASLVERARGVDLLALLTGDGVQLRHVAATNGGEYTGPCRSSTARS